MLDRFGRTIDYLRISITDRCNLRCKYCMPADGIALQPGCNTILSYEEIIRLAGIFASLGIRKIKLTGGEPLVRLGAADLIKKLKAVSGIEQVTLTTNGVLLESMGCELIEAGIDGINISLDSLRQDKFAELTRRDMLPQVIRGIEKLTELNFHNVKINCVPIQEVNGAEFEKLAELARDKVAAVRFIELMPIGYASEYTAVSLETIMQRLEQVYGRLQPFDRQIGNGPASYYALPGFKGKIGFIEAIHGKFCSECNRVRMTANGFLKLCLQYQTGVDLLELLRDGSDDAYIRKVIKKNIYLKPQEHHFAENIDNELKDSRKMFQVGG